MSRRQLHKRQLRWNASECLLSVHTCKTAQIQNASTPHTAAFAPETQTESWLHKVHPPWLPTSAPDAEFQILTRLSRDPLTIHFPSGEKATTLTSAE